MGYSALAFIYGRFSFNYFNRDKITSGTLAKNILELYSTLTPAILAMGDAQKAWDYFQKAFLTKNKIEQFPSPTCEEIEATPKRLHAAKLIGSSGLALINTALAIINLLNLSDVLDDPFGKDSLEFLLFEVAFCRLALHNVHSIKNHYRKVFPPNSKEASAYETA
jgi:hypothetical protein